MPPPLTVVALTIAGHRFIIGYFARKQRRHEAVSPADIWGTMRSNAPHAMLAQRDRRTTAALGQFLNGVEIPAAERIVMSGRHGTSVPNAEVTLSLVTATYAEHSTLGYHHKASFLNPCAPYCFSHSVMSIPCLKSQGKFKTPREPSGCAQFPVGLVERIRMSVSH
jgi:hypothetical protein